MKLQRFKLFGTALIKRLPFSVATKDFVVKTDLEIVVSTSTMSSRITSSTVPPNVKQQRTVVVVRSLATCE